MANGDIDITAAYRAFAHAGAAPGFQFQTIVGGNAFPGSTSYPAELRGDYFVLDFTDSELFAVDVHDRSDVKFLLSQSDGSMPVYLTEGPDGRVWYVDIAKGEIGSLQIEGGPAVINLDSARATYNGTSGPDVYVVDSASDSRPPRSTGSPTSTSRPATGWTSPRRAGKATISCSAGSTSACRPSSPASTARTASSSGSTRGSRTSTGGFIFGPPAGVIALGAARATYPGTAGADYYVVNSATDSIATGPDRISNFIVAQGDRVDFTATDWVSDDFVFRRFNVGLSTEYTRLDGPDGFRLRIDERLPDIAGAFIFDDGIV